MQETPRGRGALGLSVHFRVRPVGSVFHDGRGDSAGDGVLHRLVGSARGSQGPGAGQCYQMTKFDPFLSLDCTRVEGVGAQSKERKGSNFAA